MFEGFQRWLWKKLVARALRRPAPRFVHGSRPPEGQDFFAVFFEDEAASINLLVTGISDDALYGLLWNGNEYADEIEVSIKGLDLANVQVRHDYKSIWVQYRSLSSYLRGIITLRAWRLFGKYRLEVLLSIRSIKFAVDRFDLLSLIIDHHLAGQSGNIGDIQRVYDRYLTYINIYGKHAHKHKGHNREWAKFNLLVDSLIAENALIEAGTGSQFQIGPRALSLISDYATSNRRHRDAIFQNWSLIILTFVIAGAAVAEFFKSGRMPGPETGPRPIRPHGRTRYALTTLGPAAALSERRQQA